MIDNNGKYDAVRVVMDIVMGFLLRLGRTKRPYVTPSPQGETDYRMMLMGPLLDRKRDGVGSIRVYVYTDLSNDVRVRIEWTRNAFGFWYRSDIVLKEAVYDPYGVDLSGINSVFSAIRQTADGSTTVRGMNRLFRKVKKNKTRDKASRLGLMVG